MRLSIPLILAGVSFPGEGSSLGKRSRGEFVVQDYSDVDDEVEEQESGVMTGIEPTPRDAMVSILSGHPTVSAAELMSAMYNQFGISLNFLETWKLRDELFLDTRIPNWLHDILFILLPGQRLNVSLLRQLAPIGDRVYFDDMDLSRKIEIWIRVCIDPLRLYQRPIMTQRTGPPPCVPSSSTPEWSLTEEQLKLYFSSMLHT